MFVRKQNYAKKNRLNRCSQKSGPRKKPDLDVGGKPDHITLGLRLDLRLPLNVTYIRTMLGYSRVAPPQHWICYNTRHVLIKGDCWALAKVCAQSSALLFYTVVRVAAVDGFTHARAPPSVKLAPCQCDGMLWTAVAIGLQCKQDF